MDQRVHRVRDRHRAQDDKGNWLAIPQDLLRANKAKWMVDVIPVAHPFSGVSWRPWRLGGSDLSSFACFRVIPWLICLFAWTAGTARRIGAPQPIVLQPVYNAMNRLAEVEMFPACQYYGLGIVPYSPLARGVLTGKYAPGAKPAGDSRAGRNDRRMMESEFREESLRHARRIKEHAEKKGMTAGQFALNWVLGNKLVTAVIAGPRTEEQWHDYLGAHRPAVSDRPMSGVLSACLAVALRYQSGNAGGARHLSAHRGSSVSCSAVKLRST